MAEHEGTSASEQDKCNAGLPTHADILAMEDPTAMCVSRLTKLTAQALRAPGYIEVTDYHNLTEEDKQMLRERVIEANNVQTLDLAVLDQKLLDFDENGASPARSISSHSSTPASDDPDIEEELRVGNLEDEREAYYELLSDGGRPYHYPDESDFDLRNVPEDIADIAAYWVAMSSGRQCTIQQQLSRWTMFREYQDRTRRKHKNQNAFGKHARKVRQYLRKKGLQNDACLLWDRREQSKLDDWKECQFREHVKSDWYASEILKACFVIEACEVQRKAAIEAGLTADDEDSKKQYGIWRAEKHRGTCKIELQRLAVLVEWVDEQLPEIARESRDVQAEPPTQHE